MVSFMAANSRWLSPMLMVAIKPHPPTNTNNKLSNLKTSLGYHLMNLEDRITFETGKCGGRPCIRGYRLRVSDILDLIAAGASNDEILEDYPFLEPDDIKAALTFAARQTDHLVISGAA